MRISQSLLVSVDTETTGTDIANDRIVQVAVSYLPPALDEGPVWETLVDPRMPIPREAAAVHGITDARVAGAPTLAFVADELVGHLRGDRVAALGLGDLPIVVTGYNLLTFDVPLLEQELERVGFPCPTSDHPVVDPLVWAKWHHRADRSRKLVDVCARYGVHLGADAHQAGADCLAAAQLLRAMVAAGVIPDDVGEALAEQGRMAAQLDEEWRAWSYYLYGARDGGRIDGGRLHVGFGKHVGTPLDKMRPGYLEWWLANIPSPPAVVEEVNKALGLPVEAAR